MPEISIRAYRDLYEDSKSIEGCNAWRDAEIIAILKSILTEREAESAKVENINSELSELASETSVI